MTARLFSLLFAATLLVVCANAKDKDKKKPSLPEYVLRASTVLVVVSPDAGEPLERPTANADARDNVEKALMEWGRLHPVMDGADPDLVIAVRTGAGKMVQPSIKGGPIDNRAGVGQSTDSTIRIGAQHGQPPPLSDPGMGGPLNGPQNGPRVSNQVGPSEDTLEVYRGGVPNPLDSPPVWRYIAKDCLRAPQVSAVEEFRKLIAEAEKPQVPKKP